MDYLHLQLVAPDWRSMDLATSEDDDVNLYHFLVVKDDLKHDSLVRSMFLDTMCLIAQAITSTCLFY